METLAFLVYGRATFGQNPHAGLDGHLYETVVAWVRDAWPFENPGYPGREIPWDSWDAWPEP